MHTMTNLQVLGGQIATQDIFQTGTDFSTKGTAMLIAAGSFVAVLLIIIYAIQKKTMGAVMSAVAMGAIFIWALHNVTSSNVQKKIDDTVNNNGLGPAVHVEQPHALGNGISTPTA